MKKTKAGRILLGVTNLVFLGVLFTAVYSAIPPAYGVQILSATVTPVPPNQVISITYNVTNNGFYEIGNFYVVLSAYDPSGVFVSESSTLPVSIQRGSFETGTINLSILQAYITANPGNYNIVLTIHSEFAYGLIKFTVQSPQTIPLS